MFTLRKRQINKKIMIEKIKKIIDLSEIEISSKQLELLDKYKDLLIDMNQQINLISRKDEGFIFENHFAPSLTYYLLGIFEENDKKIVDIGSGGGFPGIVNAIMFPEKSFTLIDSTQKKVKALGHFIKELGLENCTAYWDRVEKIAFTKKHRAVYDVCTSRGLASLGKLIPWSLPFLKHTGVILALKGGDLSEEIKTIKKPSRYEIVEYEFDERYHYIDRFKTLKIVEIDRRRDEK